ncbi:MAG TPA: hypothetical protein VFA68_19645 [Terriglobales bacterium]|nr:hypothetical protein [Terriglobales bacterium]
MKLSLRFVFSLLILLAVSGLTFGQTWTPLTHQPTFNASTPLLLTDGTVFVQVYGKGGWWKLTPDINGSYLNGTWSQQATMPSGYGPLYYGSAVLRDGRVIVEGGEYNFLQQVETNKGAIYDPVANTWTSVNPPSGWGSIGDGPSVVLANGTYMQGDALSSREALLNASTLTWTTTGTGKADSNSEEGWNLLPSGMVLTIDANNNTTKAEKYSPATGSWSSAGDTGVVLVDPGSHEIGPAVLRPDGTLLATGATGHNAIFNTVTRTWSAAPDFPKNGSQQLDIADGPASLLPNGNVLCATSPGVFAPGTQFFEWDGSSFIPEPATPNSANKSSYEGRMLLLPTGQVIFTDATKDVEIYSPIGSPNPAWAPTITSAPTSVTRGMTYQVKGTQFNGLSQAEGYGDDSAAATNYPLVRITNQATGHVFYARTHNHSSMGVATGTRPVSTQFDVPVGAETGASNLEVVANGIASVPVTVTVQ